MDPDVCLTLGLSALAESKASLPSDIPEDAVPAVQDHMRDDAREFAQDLFDWLCKDGYAPKDRNGTVKLLGEFGFDPTPTHISRLHCRECRTPEGMTHKMDCQTGQGHGVWRDNPWS
jgi:hypothetical protein